MKNLISEPLRGYCRFITIHINETRVPFCKRTLRPGFLKPCTFNKSPLLLIKNGKTNATKRAPHKSSPNVAGHFLLDFRLVDFAALGPARRWRGGNHHRQGWSHTLRPAPGRSSAAGRAGGRLHFDGHSECGSCTLSLVRPCADTFYHGDATGIAEPQADCVSIPSAQSMSSPPPVASAAADTDVHVRARLRWPVGVARYPGWCVASRYARDPGPPKAAYHGVAAAAEGCRQQKQDDGASGPTPYFC